MIIVSHVSYLIPGILIDHETPDPSDIPQEVLDSYEHIKYEATRNLPRWLDPTTPLQEIYPASIVQVNGKKYTVIILFVCQLESW